MNLTTKQYWAVILLGFLFLGINGFLVWKLVNQEIEFDRTCPVPVDKVKGCACVYDSYFPDQLRYCTCYPGSRDPGITIIDTKGKNLPNITFNSSPWDN